MQLLIHCFVLKLLVKFHLYFQNDVGELESALDTANAVNIETQRNIKRLQESIRQSQVKVYKI